MDEDIRVSWEAGHNEMASPRANNDPANPFTTKRDSEINYHERYEVSSLFLCCNGDLGLILNVHIFPST